MLLIQKEKKYNPLLDNYVGFEGTYASLNGLLYYHNIQNGLNDVDPVAMDIEQFTIIELITYTQGDYLSIYPYLTDITDTEGSLINNDFKDIDSATYTIKGETQTSLDALATSDDSWQIRSRLDLNMGPELQQKLDINQKIVLYDGIEQE